MPIDTRDRILDAAARLFHERGFAATGVAAILREAGANAGSLYHFFPNKDALLHGVLDRHLERLEAVFLRPREASQSDPIARIFDLLDGYRGGMAATGCRHGCPIGNLALELSHTHPEVRPVLDAHFAAWRAGVRRWLDEAGDRLPADCDRNALSTMILTTMEGGLMQARTADSLEPYDRSVAVLRDHFDRLLAEARPGSPTS